MIAFLIKLSHLFFILHSSINAFPVITNGSDIHNSTFNLTPSHIDQPAPAPMPVPLMIPKIQPPKHFNLTKVAKDLKEFGIDTLKDDHHLEGLPLDRHGKVNPEFHREIFLGNHELFESNIQQNEQTRNKKLEEIFNQADVDHNERLSKDELVNYIFRNVQRHRKEAEDKNTRLFILVDTDRNGKITWQEYVALYIVLHNQNASDVKSLNEGDFIPESLSLELQQELLKIRYRWLRADSSADGELNVDEFLAFRHPEIADPSSKYIVDNLLLEIDRNDDKQLSKAEFVFVPANLSNKSRTEWPEMDKKWVESQETEFREFDENGDGILTRDELLKAYDPMNRVHISIQVKRLFSKVDDSPADESLSLNEVQKHGDVFTDMRILDAEKALHEEM